MGEYLHLIVSPKQQAIVRQELRQFPRLQASMIPECGEIRFKLSTCESVFWTLDEMIALWFVIKRHSLRYGPGHQFNATPGQLLRCRQSQYLGGHAHDQSINTSAELYEYSGITQRRTKVSLDIASQITHYPAHRKTEKVISRNGRPYWRRVKGNRYRSVTCSNTSRSFSAAVVGLGWDYKTCSVRLIHRCPDCGVHFNTGEYYDDSYRFAAVELLRSSRPIA